MRGFEVRIELLSLWILKWLLWALILLSLLDRRALNNWRWHQIVPKVNEVKPFFSFCMPAMISSTRAFFLCFAPPYFPWVEPRVSNVGGSSFLSSLGVTGEKCNFLANDSLDLYPPPGTTDANPSLQVNTQSKVGKELHILSLKKVSIHKRNFLSADRSMLPEMCWLHPCWWQKLARW